MIKQLIFFLFFASAYISGFSQSNVKIGMTEEEFVKIYSDLKFTVYENNKTYTRNETVKGLSVEWGYRFEEGKLNWIYFHHYVDKINKSEFDKCLKSTELLIEEYTELYGEPDSLVEGTKKFQDPYKKKHWGYDVIEARWKNYNGMKIKVEFTFMGGKGEYHFLVTVNFFDKNYPYYD